MKVTENCQNNFRASAGDLSDGLAKVGSAASQAGVPIQNLEGYLTALVSATGITGSEAGTALQSIISRTFRIGSEGVDDAGKTEKALSDIGVQIRDAQGNFKSFSTILDDTKSKWDGLSNAEQVNLAQQIGSTHHYSQFIGLMNNYNIAQDATTTALNSNNSAVNENAKYLDSWSGKVGTLKATMEGFYNSLTNSNVTKGFVDILSTLIKTFGNLPTIIMATTTALLLFKGTAITSAISSVGTFVGSLGSLVVANGLATTATAELGATMNLLKVAFLSNPIGMIAVGVTTAVAAFMLLKNSTQDQISKMDELSQKAQQTQADLNSLKEQAATLNDLTNKTALNTDEKAKLKQVNDDLSSKYPELISYYDKESGSFQVNIDKLNELIKKKQELAMQENANSLQEAENARKQAQQAINKANSQLKSRKGNELQGQGIQLEDNKLNTADKSKLINSIRQQQDILDKSNQSINQSVKYINDYMSAQQKAGQSTDEINKGLKGLGYTQAQIDNAVKMSTNTTNSNTSALSSNTSATNANSNAKNVNGKSAGSAANQNQSLGNVMTDLSDSMSKAQTNLTDINQLLDKHKTSGEWDYATILKLANNGYPALISAMGDDKKMTDILLQAKQDEVNNAEDSLKKQIDLEKDKVNSVLVAYGLDVSNFNSSEQAKTAILQAEVNKRLVLLQNEAKAYSDNANAQLNKANEDGDEVASQKAAQFYQRDLNQAKKIQSQIDGLKSGSLAKADPTLNDDVNNYFNLKKLQAAATQALNGVGSTSNDGKKNSTSNPKDTAASKALTAQSRDVANQSRNIAIQSRNLDMQTQTITNQENALDNQSRTLTNQSTALENQSKILDIQKQEQETAMENAQKSEQQHLDDIIKGYNNELDALKAKKDVQDETNQALDYQNKLIKDQQDLNNAQNQKVRVFMDGQWTYQSDTSKVSSARDTLSKDQEDYRRFQADQAEKKQEDTISAKIKSTQDQKDTSSRNYNNQKDALDQSYQKQQNNIDMQKMNIQNQQTNISNEKANLDQQKQNIQNQKTNLDNAKNDVANQQNSINDSRNALAGYADGTNNAESGVKEVAENGYEIVIGRQARKFKGNEVVIPHAESANILSNNNSTPTSNTGDNSDTSAILQNAQKFGQNLNKNVAQGIDQSQHTVVTANKKVLDELDNNNQNFVDKSPKYSHDTNDNMGKSTTNTKQLLKKPVSDLITEVMNEIQKFVDDSSKYGRDSNKNIGTGVNTTQESVINPTKALITNIKGLIDPFVDSFKGNGKNIDINIGQGLTDGHDGLMTDIDKLCKNIVDQFNKDLQINSPSKVMYQIGQYMIQGLIKGMDESDIEKFISDKVGGMTGAAQGSVVAVPGNVSDWLTQAMKATGVDASWLPALEMMASRESGNPGTLGTGNATLVNSEGVGGEHATGLMQTLPSTFQSYAMAGHGNILNPIDNAIASINYIKERYKTPYAIKNWNNSNYIGYQNGTDNADTGIANVAENGMELVIGKQLRRFQGSEVVIPHDKTMNILQSLMPQINTPDFSNMITPKNNVPNQTHYDIHVANVSLPNVFNGQNFVDQLSATVRTSIG